MKHARATARAALGGGRLPALIGLIGLLILGAADPGPLETLRLKTFDQLQLRFPTEPAIGPVVIVDIDERSLAEVGQWPWPRTDLARLVANLRRLGAVVVGFDMVFAETDRMSAPEIAVRLPGLDDETRAKLSAMPGSDAVLADAMRAGRIVVGQGTLPIPQVHTEQVQHPPPILVGGDPAARLHGFPGASRIVPTLDRAAHGRGMLALVPERDAIIRRMPVVLKVGAAIAPSLAVEMLRVTTGAKNYAIKSKGGVPQAVVVARVAVPTDASGRVWLRSWPHDARRFVPAHEVLAGSVDQARIKNKLVLIGTSASGLGDIHTTPAAAAIPGVEVQAQLLETIIARQELSRPSFARAVEWAAGAAIGLLLVLAAGVIGGAVYAFTQQAYLIDPSFPLLVLVVLYLTLVYARFATEERGRRQIRQTFATSRDGRIEGRGRYRSRGRRSRR